MIPADPSKCSYSGDPTTSLRDEVRFWAQDTDDTFWLITDAELDYLIQETIETTNDHPVWIASRAALAIAAKFTREVQVSADGVSVDLGSLQQKYLNLAQMLRESYDEEHGNLDLPSNDLQAAMLFGIGMSDNFEAGRQDYGERRLGVPLGHTESPEWEQFG